MSRTSAELFEFEEISARHITAAALALVERSSEVSTDPEHPSHHVVEETVALALWEELGIDGAAVGAWDAIGFSPFEAALAHGDGYTPMMAVHSSRRLKRAARPWAQRGLDTLEGLHWHRAGFGVKEAMRWRTRGVDVKTARDHRPGLRDGSISP